MDAVEDAAPACYMQGIERQKAILPEETVEFEILAEDDFGIRLAGIEWSGEFTKPCAEAPAKGEMKVVEGASQQPRVGRPAAFSPRPSASRRRKSRCAGLPRTIFPVAAGFTPNR